MTIKIPKCSWKVVADRDEKDIREHRNSPILNSDSPCYGCSGERIDCPNYLRPDFKLSKMQMRIIKYEKERESTKFILGGCR